MITSARLDSQKHNISKKTSIVGTMIDFDKNTVSVCRKTSAGDFTSVDKTLPGALTRSRGCLQLLDCIGGLDWWSDTKSFLIF